MWINAMSRVARRKGITIPDLLKQQQGIDSKQGKPSKRLERSPTKKDAFEEFIYAGVISSQTDGLTFGEEKERPLRRNINSLRANSTTTQPLFLGCFFDCSAYPQEDTSSSFSLIFFPQIFICPVDKQTTGRRDVCSPSHHLFLQFEYLRNCPKRIAERFLDVI